MNFLTREPLGNTAKPTVYHSTDYFQGSYETVAWISETVSVSLN